MGYWYSATAGYSEPDPLASDAIAVPRRPDATCLWVNGAWTASTAAHQQLQTAAQAALNKSDVTVLRCVSAAAAVPAAWQTYRTALRAIVNGADTVSTTLPLTPTYPAGT